MVFFRFFVFLVVCHLLLKINPSNASLPSIHPLPSEKIILWESKNSRMTTRMEGPELFIQNVSIQGLFDAHLIQVDQSHADDLLSSFNQIEATKAFFLEDVLFERTEEIDKVFKNFEIINFEVLKKEFINSFLGKQISFLSHVLWAPIQKKNSKKAEALLLTLVQNKEIFLNFFKDLFFKLNVIDNGLRSMHNYSQHQIILERIQKLGSMLFISHFNIPRSRYIVNLRELYFYFGMKTKMIDLDQNSKRRMFYLQMAIDNPAFPKEYLIRAFGSRDEQVRARLTEFYLSFVKSFSRASDVKDFFKMVLNSKFIMEGMDFNLNEEDFSKRYINGALNIFLEWHMSLLDYSDIKNQVKDELFPVLKELEQRVPYFNKTNEAYDPHLLENLRRVQKTLLMNELGCMDILRGIMEKSKSKL